MLNRIPATRVPIIIYVFKDFKLPIVILLKDFRDLPFSILVLSNLRSKKSKKEKTAIPFRTLTAAVPL